MQGYRHVDIVLRGNFNPLIFQPAWFRNLDLLPGMEIDAAEGAGTQTILTQEFVSVRFASLHLEVVADRWALSTERPDWMKDLGGITASIWAHLPHTPLRAFGANSFEHARVDASVDGLLQHWAPLAALGQVAGEKPRASGIVTATWEGYQARLLVEKSERLPNGLFVHQNFHRDLRGGVTELRDVLATDWSRIVGRSKDVAQLLVQGERAS